MTTRYAPSTNFSDTTTIEDDGRQQRAERVDAARQRQPAPAIA